MKLLIVSSTFPPMKAAEADYAFHLCAKLAARGAEVELITSARAGLPEIKGVRTFARKLRWSWRDLPWLAWKIWRRRPDAVLLLYLGWIYDGHPMITFLPVFTRKLLPRTVFLSLFYNRYGADLSRASGLTRRLQRLAEILVGHREGRYEFGALLTHGGAVFALNHAHADRLKTIAPSAAPRIEVLPSLPLLMPAHLSREEARHKVRRALGLKEDEALLGFFGYLYPGKGLETLLDALAQNPHLSPLVLIGGKLDPASDFAGYPAEIVARIAKLGLRSKVHATGGYEFDSELPAEHLLAIDAVVLPFDTGISLNNSSVAAAAAHGVPIVSTAGPDLEAAFVHGENVWLCPPGDAAALALGLQRVLSDSALRARLAEGARHLARSHFSWDKAVDRVLAASVQV